jgi:flagellar hook-associated protein 3 FlgL
MRIANKTVYENITRNLNLTSSAMFQANQVVSSAKVINKLSDDPVGLTSVLDIRSSLSNLQQLERAVNTGRSWLSMGESVLTRTEDILVQTQSLTVQMADASKGIDQRTNAAEVVDGYLRQILSLANTEVGGRYIFSGTKTDTASFFYDEGGSGQVIYNGDDTPFSVRIAKDISLDVGRDGEDIFGENWDGENIFKTMIDLKTALLANDVPGIQSALDKLENHQETVRNTVADTGAKMVRLDVKEQVIQELNITYTERMSSIEDADVAEAVMHLKSKELAYQAALASSSKVLGLSLVNYL